MPTIQILLNTYSFYVCLIEYLNNQRSYKTFSQM